ncbi:MAG: restriction endonuclease [Thermoproteota archaeon]|nr:MAG: restriction endonuclease [Candidatus Korarchaeota archaeon]
MEIIAEFSFNKGKEFIEKNHRAELQELREIISLVDASRFKTKVSKEKTMEGRLLYNPKELNNEFKRLLKERGWKKRRIQVKTVVPEIAEEHKGFREMDFVKNKLGVEIQFGKYAFMVYNVCAKMTIFAKQGIIDSGVEVIPMLSLAREMSTGVSYYEQMKTDLEYRGVSNIDIPVLVIGVDAVKRPRQSSLLSEFG